MPAITILERHWRLALLQKDEIKISNEDLLLEARGSLCQA